MPHAARAMRAGPGQENRRLHVAAWLAHPCPPPHGARRALLRSRGWRQGLPVWDPAATCCPQPQPHNGALVHRQAAGGGRRAVPPGPPWAQSRIVWGGCPGWAALSRPDWPQWARPQRPWLLSSQPQCSCPSCLREKVVSLPEVAALLAKAHTRALSRHLQQLSGSPARGLCASTHFWLHLATNLRAESWQAA